MGYKFTGQVLEGVRLSPANQATTDEPSDGVLRDIRFVPFDPGGIGGGPGGDTGTPVPHYVTVGGVGDGIVFTDLRADQYRTATILAPGTTSQEWLVWAQNTSQLALVDDPSWWTNSGVGNVPVGTLSVVDLRDPLVPKTDGSSRFVVVDDGNRSVGSMILFVAARGDVDYDDGGWEDPEDPDLGRKGDNPYPWWRIAGSDQNPVSGVVKLTAAQLTALGGGLSMSRGDRIVEIRYTVSSAKFWWTKNDRYQKRFGWSDKTQRWEPWKGCATKNLGTLLLDKTTFQMTPKVNNLPVGAFLPGDGAVRDSWSMIRLGSDPGVSSVPAAPGGTVGFTGILVRPDDEISEFDFGAFPDLVGVMGQSDGSLSFNPAFVLKHAGKQVWYSQKDFTDADTGVVGKLLDAKLFPLFISPIPGPTDFPLLRYGTRTHLQARTFFSDADMDAAGVPAEGEIFVSMSTGRLAVSPVDVAKADPSSPSTFDKQWYGTVAVYDGVALCKVPQPTAAPVMLVDADGIPVVVDAEDSDQEFFLPESDPFPMPTDPADTYRGLGSSGMLHLSSETGAVPAPGLPGVRPGGDNPGDDETGMVRALFGGVGDVIFFNRALAISTVIPVDVEDDLPGRGKVRKGCAYICLKDSPWPTLSKVVLSDSDVKAADGDHFWFLRATFAPATWTDEARIFSRNRDIFRFDGTEKFFFATTWTPSTWSSSSLTTAFPDKDYFTAAEVAASIAADSVPPPVGRVWAHAGRIVIEASDLATGFVEIGWGPVGGAKDFSGAAALGFLPGWRVFGGMPNWVVDSGASLGLARSPINLDRTSAIPDFAHVERLRETVLSESVPPNPFQFFINPPIEDIAGYDEGTFFNLTNIVQDGDDIRVVSKYLQNWEDVVYRFGQGKFDWVAWDSRTETVDRIVTTINLGHAGVVPESMRLAPGIPGFLSANVDGQGDVWQDPDNDYVMPQDGVTGTATLIRRYGKRVLFGAQGAFSAGGTTFSDDTVANFTDPKWGIAPGYRLRIDSQDGQGSYVVEAVAAHSLTVSPAFLVDSATPAVWEVFEGFSKDVYDPMLVADVLYDKLAALPEEPFKVRVLSPLGVVPTTPAELAANRPKANVEGALRSGRVVSIRYGATAPTATNVASILWLTKASLGTIANGSLVLPDLARFDARAVAVQIGTATWAFSADTLVAVPTFSADPGDKVQALTVPSGGFPKGALKFGSQVLAKFPSARVLAVEDFLSPADLPALMAECDPVTGGINFSQADMDAFGGTTEAWFAEQMVTDNDKDVSIQPASGTCAFFQPLPKGVLVEMSYWAADLEGRQVGNEIVEFLPTFVRNEIAVRERPNVFTYGVGKRPRQDIDPIVFVRAVQQNYGETNYVTDYSDDGRGRLTFVTYDITDGCDVKVSYAVMESQGGERVYESSVKPVYRPPFFIKTGQNRFGLRTDRRAEFKPGQLIRIGDECFYVKGTKYFPPVPPPPPSTDTAPSYMKPIPVGAPPSTGDITAVYIFPPTIQEVGTRAPGRDVFLGITPMAVTPVVDPDGEVVVPDVPPGPATTDAARGIMFDVDLTTFPFDPVNRGQTTVVFKGNLTKFAVPGHIMEIGGVPYVVTGSEMTDDGTRTKVTFSTGVRKSFTVDQAPPVRLTWRPIYPPNCRSFLGVGPFVDTEGWEIVLWGEDGGVPGRTLVPDAEYAIDKSTGAVQLLEPLQAALNAPQRLTLSHTLLRGLQPWVQDGVVNRPTWTANYLWNEAPSAENGILGGTLATTYTFRNPDTFYFRSATMSQFLVDVTVEVTQEVSSQQPASGAPKPTGKPKNWTVGRVGFKTERKHLLDKDRAARTFLDFYNTAILAFEQIEETISGDVVGDLDGKFRFWIGRGKEWPAPGYEDDISGTLTLRNIWTEVFSNWLLEGDYLYFQPKDPFVDPWNFTLADGVVDGDTPDSDFIRNLMDQQKSLVRNDVDDYILGRLRSHRKWKAAYPFWKHILRGYYFPMYWRHQYSRLFPTWTKTFLRLNPGLGADEATGDNGFFTAGRNMYDPKKKKDVRRRTTRDEIGQVQNPVVGDITMVNSISLWKRRASARVWKYLSDGVPAGSFGQKLGLPVPPADIPGPVFVATPLMLKDFPINPKTGWPDVDAMASVNPGTGVADIVSGDPDMAIPGFIPWQALVIGGVTLSFGKGDQITVGKPDGVVWALRDASGGAPTPGGGTALPGIFVDEILYGCVVTLADASGAAIADPWRVILLNGETTGTPAHLGPDAVVRGDTILTTAADGNAAPSDPPTSEELKEIAESSDTYRIGFDVGVHRDGKIYDMTFPSYDDPRFFGIKEVVGQNPPPPLSCIGGVVNFHYEGQNPLEIPALNGEGLDDSGDRAVPYIKIANTELDRFTDGGDILADILTVDARPPRPLVDSPPWGVWPDEFVANDGTATTVTDPPTDVVPPDEPAALMTTEDLAPRTPTSDAWGDGTGNVRPMDLLFVQVQDVADPAPGPFSTGAGAVKGPQGIHSVGRVRLRDGAWNLDPASGDPPTVGIGSLVEPPRFVTRTTPPSVPLSPDTGSPVRYVFENAMVQVDDPQPPDPPPVDCAGVKVYTYKHRGIVVFDFTGTNFTLHDGMTPGTGGLNAILNLADINKRFNKVIIRLISRKDFNIAHAPGGASVTAVKAGGVVVETFTITYDLMLGVNKITAQDYVPWGHAPGASGFTAIHFGESVNAVVPGLPGIATPADNRFVILTGVVNTDNLALWQTPPPGTDTDEWFIPYTETADTGPHAGTYWQGMNYGEDVTVGMDTSFGDPTTATWAQSTTGWVDEDRLTFHECYDLRWMKERGFAHPLNPATVLESRFNFAFWGITAGHTAAAQYWSSVNSRVNGMTGPTAPVPFTFLPRAGVIGEWTAATLTAHEDGHCSVMGFEGWSGAVGNIPVLAFKATFSAVPSNEFCWISDPMTGAETCERICRGTGDTESKFSAIPPVAGIGPMLMDDRILSISVSDGAVSRVQPGDVVVVEKSANATHWATTKAGTYLVRHAIAENDPVVVAGRRVTAPTITLGTAEGSGWCPLTFPTVVSWDSGTRKLTLSDLAPLPWPVIASVGWSGEIGFHNAPDYVYILLNPNAVATVDSVDPAEHAAALAAFQKSVLRLRYTFFDLGANSMTIDVANCRYADGTAIALADINTLLAGAMGVKVSGMRLWPVNVSGADYGLPDDNVVGFHNPTVFPGIDRGFEGVSLQKQNTVLFAPTVIVPQDPQWVLTPEEFNDYRHAPVYNQMFKEVVCGVNVDAVSGAQWKDVNGVDTGATWFVLADVACVLPGTTAAVADLTADPPVPKHHAVAGIFFQPAFPRQALDLIPEAPDHPRIVDSEWTFTMPDPAGTFVDSERELGMRQSDFYYPSVPAAFSKVSFEVRRPRRFHPLGNIDLKLAPLRFVWEIRRGRVRGYTTAKQRGLVTAKDFVMNFDATRGAGTWTKTADVWNDGKTYSGTNLGTFDNADVNVHAGDMFRLIGDDGTLLEEVRIETVYTDPTDPDRGWKIRLAAPGLVTCDAAELTRDGGMRFEIWINQPPVPHEQSNEQLFDLVTDKTVCQTDATWGDDPDGERGGYVPEFVPADPWTDQANLLFDDLEADGSTPDKTFAGRGVQAGDIVIVDPLGKIPRKDSKPTIQEKGVRPLGDEGVPGRIGWWRGVNDTPTFQEGAPNVLDDNRGFWRVTKVADQDDEGNPPHLVLNPINTYAGDLGMDKNVVFDKTDSRRAYAVVPTVSDSKLNVADPDPTKHVERQMDLRPTKARDPATGKFAPPGLPTWHSIRPFSYRVVRPSSLFSTEALDLVFHTRERMFTLIELVGRGFEGKSGDWWDFQKFLHCHDLGLTWDPESGLGLLRNVFIMAVLGRTDVTPFMNNSGAVSFLDRRFWILDRRLDSLVPTALSDHRPFGMKLSDGSPPPLPYTAWEDPVGGKVRPVLPERIDQVLDQRDRFRPIRYVWLAYRTHEILGTLAAIRRFDAELPDRKRKQLEALLKILSLRSLT